MFDTGRAKNTQACSQYLPPFTVNEGLMSPYHNDLRIEQLLDEEESVMSGRKEFLEKRAERILSELEKLEAYGEDDYDDEAVLLFKYRFRNSDTVYSYVAFKIKGHWYLSGKSGSRLSWDELVKFWCDGEVSEMWYCSGWEQVF